MRLYFKKLQQCSRIALGVLCELWPNLRRKLDQIDAVTRLKDLRVPPGNKLHALGGALRGFHAIRVNNAIVKGRRGVSADTALLLEALTDWDAQIWLTLQSKWDLWHAMKARGRRPKVRRLRKTA